jgi:RHS repeat-associated protein
MTNPISTVLSETTQLANDLGTIASNSARLGNLPEKNDENNLVNPKSGINFVLYNSKFEVVEENTGYLPVEDHINAIQNLATDKLVMKEAGFIEIFVNNEAQTPVYYDNLMVVMRGGGVSEVNAYYPFGTIISDLSTIVTYPLEQNYYKYNGKELQEELGLNWLDYGARMMDPAVGRWWLPDPLAEKFYNISPYAYAANNPIRFIDPDGLTHYSIDSLGNISYMYNGGGYIIGENDDYDMLFAADGSSIRIENTKIISSLRNRKDLGKKDEYGKPLIRSMYTGDESSADDIFNTFVFLSNNTKNEWRFTMHNGNKFTVGTLNSDSEVGNVRDFEIDKTNVSNDIHSHPGVRVDEAYEMDSMGSDWANVGAGRPYNTFVYFPNSRNLYKLLPKEGAGVVVTLPNYQSLWRKWLR